MRMIKTITATATLLAVMPAFADTITCVSVNDAFTRCDLAHADRYGVQIQNMTAGNTGTCTSDSWGADSKGIWVKNGCGAVFQYTPTSSTQKTQQTTTNEITYSDYNDGAYYDEPYYYSNPDYLYYYPGFYPGGAIFFTDEGYYHNGNYYHNANYYHNGQYHDGHYHDGHGGYPNGGHASGYHGGVGTFHGHGGGFHSGMGGGGHHR